MGNSTGVTHCKSQWGLIVPANTTQTAIITTMPSGGAYTPTTYPQRGACQERLLSSSTHDDWFHPIGNPCRHHTSPHPQIHHTNTICSHLSLWTWWCPARPLVAQTLGGHLCSTKGEICLLPISTALQSFIQHEYSFRYFVINGVSWHLALLYRIFKWRVCQTIWNRCKLLLLNSHSSLRTQISNSKGCFTHSHFYICCIYLWTFHIYY